MKAFYSGLFLLYVLTSMLFILFELGILHYVIGAFILMIVVATILGRYWYLKDNSKDDTDYYNPF